MIAVTGASGKLGQHVVEGLLKKVSAGEIVAVVRDVAKADRLAERGIQVRQGDYSHPETLGAAFAGVDKVLLISSSENGRRVPQHQAVADAAKSAGVKLLAYTSILRADTSALLLAPEHKATEEYVRQLQIPFVFLRNGWYLENHTEAVGMAVQYGAVIGAAGDGRFASAARADYAQAAVEVLTTAGHENKTYELAGDTPYTLAEVASEVSTQTGKQIVYNNLSVDAYAAALVGFGLPDALAGALADADLGAARGELDSSSHDLSGLLHRPTTSLSTAVREALQKQ